MADDRIETATTALAGWVDRLAFSDIPELVVRRSEQLVVDALGVAAAATSDPVGAAALDWAGRFAAPGDATVIGSGRRVSPVDAALANGTLVHALDFDDHGFGGHGTACVLPAVLAAGEAAGLDGPELITAYVAGMEVFGRVGDCMPVVNIHGYGFHPTAVLGLLGASAAVGKALGLDAAGIARTVSVAVSRGAGLTASFGTMVKPLHAGQTAAAGVQAADLARSGFAGNPAVLEGEHGFGTAYVRDLADWAAFTASLAGPFRMESKPPSIKPFACCGGNQRSIQALSRIMRDNDLHDEDIAGVVVHVNPRQLVTLRYDWPTTAYEAKFCLPFSVATTISHGGPSLAAFAGRYWEDERVLRARERVRIVPDGDGHKNKIELVATTTGGREFTRTDFVMHGSGDDPMSWDEISAKYRDNCGYAKLDPEVTGPLHDASAGLGAPGSGTAFWGAWRALTHGTR